MAVNTSENGNLGGMIVETVASIFHETLMSFNTGLEVIEHRFVLGGLSYVLASGGVGRGIAAKWNTPHGDPTRDLEFVFIVTLLDKMTVISHESATSTR